MTDEEEAELARDKRGDVSIIEFSAELSSDVKRDVSFSKMQ